MPCDFANYSDEEYWSDPDQLSHYFYLKDKYGYKCAKEFAIKSKYFNEETEEEQDVQDWNEEEISYEEISDSEEEYGPPLRKKHKIQETDSEDEEGCTTD